jgi:hypothetical protein
MPELLMASPGSGKVPAVVGQEAEEIPNLHCLHAGGVARPQRIVFSHPRHPIAQRDARNSGRDREYHFGKYQAGGCMSWKRFVMLLAVAVATACVASPRLATQLGPFPVDSVQRPLGPAFDSAAQAFGLRPLAATPLAGDVEEIRYWSGGGITAEQDFVRLTRAGNRVDGLLGLYWRIVTPYDRPGSIPQGTWVRFAHQGTCRRVTDVGNFEACELKLRGRPDWTALWDSLAALGVATLPPQSSLTRPGLMINDGGRVIIELRTATGYRRYSYENPWSYHDPEDQRVVSIQKALGLAWSLVPRPTSQRQLRGRLDLALGGDEFVACHSRVAWAIEGARTHPMIASARDSTAHASYYIEALGQLAMHGLRSNARYPETVQVLSVDSVAPWDPKRC